MFDTAGQALAFGYTEVSDEQVVREDHEMYRSWSPSLDVYLAGAIARLSARGVDEATVRGVVSTLETGRRA